MASELGEAEAEGATQDVLERAAIHRTAYHGSLGSPDAWLWGIARNVRNNRLSASARRQQLLGLLVLAPPPSGMTEIEAIAVIEEIERLQPMDQQIIQLRFWQGKTFAEIAQVLEISAESARKRTQRCIRRLLQALNGPDPE
jgi:RNA polymerase sigma-70 factor (ECF subfamily)